LAEELLEAVERKWPGLVGDVEVRRVATPLSAFDYARAVRGGVYGPESSIDQFGSRRFRTQTPIRGLFLAGSGVDGPGVVSCLRSGRAAAEAATRRLASTKREIEAQPMGIAHHAH
jgi:phytoene dehydrogenase-like protein